MNWVLSMNDDRRLAKSLRARVKGGRLRRQGGAGGASASPGQGELDNQSR